MAGESSTTDGGGSTPSNPLRTFLQSHPSVKFIRFSVIDYGNVNRTKLLPVSRALGVAADPNGSGVTFPSPLTSAITNIGELIFDFVNSHEDVYMPDWNTLRQIPQEPAHAMVFCWIQERIEPESDWLARDPRSVLSRVVKEAKEKFGVDFKVGYEIEFNVLKSMDATSLVPGPATVWPSAITRSPYFKIVEESVLALEENGIPVWAFHGEGGSGTFEISTCPMSPLEAVDALYYSHEVIKTIGAKHGCHVTMHPKPFEKEPSIGQHVHISLSKPEMGDHFLASLLKRFRALCGLLLSGKDSYQRNFQFGIKGISFGDRNKMNTIKRMEPAYFEIRPPDCLSNAYLQLAAIIGVGMHGVEGQEPLRMKPNQTLRETGLTKEEMEDLGITDDYPRDADEALDELEKDEVIKAWLGAKCFDRYIAHKRFEYKKASNMPSDDRRLALLQTI